TRGRRAGPEASVPPMLRRGCAARAPSRVTRATPPPPTSRNLCRAFLGQPSGRQLLMRLIEAVLRFLAAHPRDELVDPLSERHLGLEPQQPPRQPDVGV